ARPLPATTDRQASFSMVSSEKMFAVASACVVPRSESAACRSATSASKESWRAMAGDLGGLLQDSRLGLRPRAGGEESPPRGVVLACDHRGWARQPVGE